MPVKIGTDFTSRPKMSPRKPKLCKGARVTCELARKMSGQFGEGVIMYVTANIVIVKLDAQAPGAFIGGKLAAAMAVPIERVSLVLDAQGATEPGS